MDIEQISFKDLVDLQELRLLFENLSAATGFATDLIDHATNEVLVSSGWRDICVKFHRACPDSQKHCTASNKQLTSGLNHAGDIHIHHCKNGLVDGCTPVFIQGKHLADLVITDQTMPRLTGAELAQEILEIKSDMPIILCTGYSSVLSETEALAIGIKSYTRKPVDRTTLATVVRQVLDENNSLL